MRTEDRLRAALTDRADATRTSPDALDTVFGRVARHRRNVRVAATLGVVAAVAAGATLVTTLGDRRDALRPTEPTPTAVLTQEPTASPPAPTRAPRYATYPETAVVVVRATGAVVVVDSVTGDEIDTLGELGAPADGGTYDWSPDRRYLYWHDDSCTVHRHDLATGRGKSIGPGRQPVANATGAVAAIGCDGQSLVVYDGDTETTYPKREWDEWYDRAARFTAVAWVDGLTLLVSRQYESAERLVRVDRADERPLADALILDDVADAVVGGDVGSVVTATYCCYTEEQGPAETTFHRLSGIDAERGPGYEGEKLFTVSGRALHYTAVGDAVVFLNEGSLWRWEPGGEPRRVLEGVTLLAR